ncbi:MAG: hypothetical protein J5855_00985 [Mailhella sp.]|nr:hypothetical protein [Mailhella sp.]
MSRLSHTTDETGFNYMDNSGVEERDRDMVGITLAIVFMVAAVLCQTFGLL